MRWTTLAAAVLGIVVVPAVTSAQGTRAARQEYDRATDASFSSTTDASGNAVITVRGGDFLLEKVLAQSGDTTLRLTQGKDVVTIALNQTGYAVSRGRRTARFDPSSSQPEARDEVRSVLVGSKAVRTFRRLAAELEDRDESTDDSALVLSTLLDGALVQMLDGDSGATKRIGRRVTRKERGRLVPVKRAPDTFRDCMGLYVNSLMSAWDLYWQCYTAAVTTAWWYAYWAETACEFAWLVRSQQYIWQFVGCAALPF
jgi:hypothetical protein